MKFVFFGTPTIAVFVLEQLLQNGYIPSAVVTNADRPVGRKKIITAPPVKQFVEKSGLPIKIFQPENLLEFKKQLSDIGADVGVLAAYGKILPKEVIDIFPKGILVVHPSLLPKHRGPTPVQSALLAGEKETGTCLMQMDEKVDHGPVIACQKIIIDDADTTETLNKKLFTLGGQLLVQQLPDYLSGKLVGTTQNEREATYVKKFSTADGFVDLEKDTPEVIWRKVRALNPEPGVFTLSQSKGGRRRMKILEVEYREGKITLKKVQYEGEKIKILE